VPLPLHDLRAGLSVQNAFVLAGLAASNGEVRRAIANKAIQINDARITDNGYVISEKDVTPQGVIKLSFGRKSHVLLKPT
jgi:tyrosyl-tRNA synthetase